MNTDRDSDAPYSALSLARTTSARKIAGRSEWTLNGHRGTLCLQFS